VSPWRKGPSRFRVTRDAGLGGLKPGVIWLLVMGLSGCGTSERRPHTLVGGNLEDLFRISDEIQIQEEEGDIIGQIGAFLETEAGGFLIGDRILPRIRLYGPEGRLLAAAGSFGEGPFEFRNVRGIAQNSAGEILVTDVTLGRVTVFSSGLVPDTTFMPHPRPRGPILRMGETLAMENAPGTRSTAISRVDPEGTPVWSVVPPSMALIAANPYWGSTFSMPIAASSTLLATAISLAYPVYLYDGEGRLVDSLPLPPPSYRPTPTLAPGALTGPEVVQTRKEWLGSFEIIGNLAVVDDSLLVVTHGRLATTSTDRFQESHYAIDVYHLPSMRKVAEDLDLPPGSVVLGGGTALYVLIKQPPEPWTIVRLEPLDREVLPL